MSFRTTLLVLLGCYLLHTPGQTQYVHPIVYTSSPTHFVQTSSPTTSTTPHVYTSSPTRFVQTSSPTASTKPHVYTSSPTSTTRNDVHTSSPTTSTAPHVYTSSPTSSTTQNVHTSSPTTSTTQNVHTSSPTTSTTRNDVHTSSPTASTTQNVLTSSPTTSTTRNILTGSPTSSTTKNVLTSNPTSTATTVGTTNCDECVISGSTRTCSIEENGVDVWGHCETQDDGCNRCVTTDATTTTTDEATTTEDTSECDADYLPFCYANDRCQAGSNVAGAIGSLCKVCVAMDALDVDNRACSCDDVKTEIQGQALDELNLSDKIVEKIVENCWTSTEQFFHISINPMDTWTCSGVDGVAVEDPDTCGCCVVKCNDIDADGCGLSTTTDGNYGEACRYGVGVAVSFVIAVLSWT